MRLLNIANGLADCLAADSTDCGPTHRRRPGPTFLSSSPTTWVSPTPGATAADRDPESRCPGEERLRFTSFTAHRAAGVAGSDPHGVLRPAGPPRYGPRYQERQPGHAAGVGQAPAGDAEASRVSLVPFGQMACRWQAAGQWLDHSYSLNDHDRHFSPRSHTEDDKPLAAVDPKSGYYSSTAIADHAVKCLGNTPRNTLTRPFLEYLALPSRTSRCSAARGHRPLPQEVPRRLGRDAEDRWQRLKELKISGTSSPLSNATRAALCVSEAIRNSDPTR